MTALHFNTRRTFWLSRSFGGAVMASAGSRWSGPVDVPALGDADGAGGLHDRCGFHEVGRASYRGTPFVYFEWVLATNS